MTWVYDPNHENAFALVVVDSKRRNTRVDVKRKLGESIEVFAERVKQATIDLLTKPNS